jgi:hypothetical protein
MKKPNTAGAPPRKFIDPLDDILDRPIAFQRSFKRITGSTPAALFLSQAWYWSKRTSDADGWFYKSGEEWEEETGLTRSERETARKICKALGIVEEKLKGVPATLFYRVNRAAIYELLGVQFVGFQQTGLQEPGKPESGNHTNFNKEPESTTENTTLSGGEIKLIIESANRTVDAIFDLDKNFAGPRWAHREKVPAAICDLLDVWVECSGIEPTKANLSDWIATGQNWLDVGAGPADVRKAYKLSRPNEATGKGGFSLPPTRPAAISGLIGAVIGERKVAGNHNPKDVRSEYERLYKENPDEFNRKYGGTK